MSAAAQSAFTLQEVSKRLVALRQDGHWRCDADFLNVTGLERGKMRRVVMRWDRCDQEIWLDVLANEIALSVVSEVGTEVQDLPSGWKREASQWGDVAHKQAFQGVSLAPPRLFSVQKARLFTMLVLSRRPQAANHGTVESYGDGKVICPTCNYRYPPHVDSCPECARQRRDTLKREEAARLEAKEAVWRSLASVPIGIDGEPKPRWQEIMEFKHCQGGSGGVFMVRLPAGAICLRGAGWNAVEALAEGFAESLGVRVAASRPVVDSDEHQAILEGLMQAEPFKQDDAMQLKVSSGLRIHVTPGVLQFVRGVPMMGLPAHKCLMELMTKAKPDESEANSSDADAGEPPAPQSTKLWSELGRLMGFDILINNYDRFPVVWSNDGNLGNVMLGSSGDSEDISVVGIDQKIHPILHAGGLAAYLERVKKAVSAMQNGSVAPLGATKDAIYANTGIEVGESELGEMREGCLAMLRKASDLSSTEELLPRLRKVAAKLLETCPVGALMHEEALQHSCSLVQDVAEVVRTVLDGGEPANER